MNNPRIEQAARAAYEAHHEGMDDLAWHEMMDWQKERWRRAAQAVIDLVTSHHPLIRTA
ncbi:MAG: hypothetical protein ACR2OE_14930 [Thermomicrobiales bacterium]